MSLTSGSWGLRGLHHEGHRSFDGAEGVFATQDEVVAIPDLFGLPFPAGSIQCYRQQLPRFHWIIGHG